MHCYLIDWLILMACQPVNGKVRFIVHSYLHFCVVVSEEFFGTQLYNNKYSNLTQIISIPYDFMYLYLILIIIMFQVIISI